MNEFVKLIDAMPGTEEAGLALCDAIHRRNVQLFGGESIDSIGRRLKWHLGRRGMKLVYDKRLKDEADRYGVESMLLGSTVKVARLEPVEARVPREKIIEIGGKIMYCPECGCGVFLTDDGMRFTCTSCKSTFRGIP